MICRRPSTRGRFLREVKIAAQLQHPHILPLLDSGEAAGFLYFVMPYVKGQSLRERLARDGELPSISRATCVMRVESSHSDTERLQLQISYDTHDPRLNLAIAVNPRRGVKWLVV
jgi:serine/threonine protein kinase